MTIYILINETTGTIEPIDGHVTFDGSYDAEKAAKAQAEKYPGLSLVLFESKLRVKSVEHRKVDVDVEKWLSKSDYEGYFKAEEPPAVEEPDVQEFKPQTPIMVEQPCTSGIAAPYVEVPHADRMSASRFHQRAYLQLLAAKFRRSGDPFAENYVSEIIANRQNDVNFERDLCDSIARSAINDELPDDSGMEACAIGMRLITLLLDHAAEHISEHDIDQLANTLAAAQAEEDAAEIEADRRDGVEGEIS